MNTAHRRSGPAGSGPRPTTTFLVGILLVVILTISGAAQVRAQSAQPPANPLRVTLAAYDDESSGAGAIGPAGGGIIIMVGVENRDGPDLAGLSVRVPAPPRTTIAASWQGRPGERPGSTEQSAVIWTGLSLRKGERIGPFAYRVIPGTGADGATIFREATVAPEVAWTQPVRGRAEVPLDGIRLNGLWGEEGLRRTVLSSGLTVFTRERPDTATVAIRLAVRAGSRDEDDVTSGGSHWLEHAHFLGTRTRENLDLEIEAVGGDSNASTGWEATDYWNLVPGDQFEIALDVLADQMINSTFDRTKFDRERRVVFEELKLRNDSPSVRAFDEFINLVFRASPLRRHPAGTIESVQAIPVETILAYRERHYVTGNMAVAASGDLRHDDAVNKIERSMAGLRVGPRQARASVAEPVQASPRRLEVGDGSQIAEIALGWPAPGDLHADSPAMTVIEDLLGESGRRLAEEIRDRRALATSVEPGYFAFSDAGAFMISASTRPERTEQVVDLILAEVRNLRDGRVTDDDVRASIRAIAGRQALDEESNRRQTGRARAEVSGTLESWDEYMARLRRVTAADVQRVARHWMDLENNTRVIVRF